MIRLNVHAKEVVDSSRLPLRERIRILFHLQRYLLPYWDKLILRLLSSIALYFLGIIPPLLVPRILDEAFPHRDMVLLLKITAVSVFVGILMRILGYVAGAERADAGGTPCNVMSAYLMPRIAVTLKHDFFHHVQTLSVTDFSSRPVGEHMFRSTNDCEDAAFLSSEVIPKVFSVLQRVIVVVFVIQSFGWWLIIPVAIYLVLFFAVKHKIATSIRKWDRQYRVETQRLESVCREVLYPWKLVKAYNLERLARFWYGNQACRSARSRFMRDVLLQFDNYFTFVALGAFWGILGTVMGWFVIQGSLTFGEQGAVGGLVIMLIRPFEDVISTVQLVRQKLVPAERMLETLAIKPSVPEPEESNVFFIKHGSVDLQNVSFGYTQDNPVIRNLTLSVRPGEKLAIVGHTGAGKSTLLGLILRLYDPQEGRVLIDGVDVRTVKQEDLRKGMAIVPQQIVTFADTIEANIRFGNHRASDELFQQAAHAARVDEFALRLPNGYQTLLNEAGGISGGQQQRVAIARALIRQPAILLLDEATSALDPVTEKEVVTEVDRFCASATRIIVAHNVLTAKSADRVVVLHHGQIVETGTHEELMEKGQFYFRLWVNESVQTVV